MIEGGDYFGNWLCQSNRTLASMDTTYLQNFTDVDLVAAIAKRDETAFEVLYHKYEKRVYYYLKSILEERQVVEEVLVDVMVAVWNGAEKFRGGSQVSTWIFGIAHHKAVDAIRRLSSYQRKAVPLEDISDTADIADGPEEKTEQKNRAALTNHSLKALSNEHREILHLVFYEELSYLEVSTLLGIPINTVKTRVFYAKNHLKRELEHLGLDEKVE